jgi:hypothetical protein
MQSNAQEVQKIDKRPGIALKDNHHINETSKFSGDASNHMHRVDVATRSNCEANVT